MALVISNKLLEQMKKFFLEKDDKVNFSVLLGTIDTELNEITILKAIHFPIQKNTRLNLVLPNDVLNQLKSLQFMLPYMLEIIGLAYYIDEEISFENIMELAASIKELPTLKFLVNVQKLEIKFYQISEEKPIKITANTKDFDHVNLLKFIYTMEFETSNKVLENQNELKKSLLDGLDLLWDKITFSKDSKSSLYALQQMKNSLDRTIEITIPYEEKHLSVKTGIGKAFLALDLHMNLFLSKSLQDKKLIEIKELLNKALKRDLIVKLQRSVYDKKIQRLITPAKIPMSFFDIELTAYLLNDNPSKYEYQLCNNLIFHARKMAEIGDAKLARIFIRDLVLYYQILNDENKQLELGKLIVDLAQTK
ncbi:MAG: hypothetical protein JXA54_09450 [Candidatus Heimdallarchaeota archaeon]|nr:hypothetical protein [Candidatus Heimdallarchaeota archaeon]